MEKDCNCREKFLLPFSIDSADFPCIEPSISSPHSFYGQNICSVTIGKEKKLYFLTLYWPFPVQMWSQKFCKFSAFGLEFQKFSSITITIFFSQHVRTIFERKYVSLKVFSKIMMNSSFFHTGNLALRKCLCQKCADELKVIFMNSSKFLLEENLMRISDQITHGG